MLQFLHSADGSINREAHIQLEDGVKPPQAIQIPPDNPWAVQLQYSDKALPYQDIFQTLILANDYLGYRQDPHNLVIKPPSPYGISFEYAVTAKGETVLNFHLTSNMFWLMGEQIVADNKFVECSGVVLHNKVPFATVVLKAVTPSPLHPPSISSDGSTPTIARRARGGWGRGLQPRGSSPHTFDPSISTDIKALKDVKMPETNINVLRNTLGVGVVIFMIGGACGVYAMSSGVPDTNIQLTILGTKPGNTTFCTAPILEAAVDVAEWFVKNPKPDAGYVVPLQQVKVKGVLDSYVNFVEWEYPPKELKPFDEQAGSF